MGILLSADPISARGEPDRAAWCVTSALHSRLIVSAPATQLMLKILIMSPITARTFLCGLLVIGTSLAASTTEKMAAMHSPGSAIPAETRPCVDCHAFEFMERALRDLYKAAYNLDSQTERLLLRAEDRGLCDCLS